MNVDPVQISSTTPLHDAPAHEDETKLRKTRGLLRLIVTVFTSSLRMTSV